HHLAVDGVSWRILLEDIQTCLKQAHQGEPLLLPEKTDSFKYWSEKLRQYAAGQFGKALFKEKEYWETIENTEIKPVPVDNKITREKRKQKYCDSVAMDLDKNETEDLFKKVNWAYGTEINDILLAALALALKEWKGLDKTLVNLEGHGREPIIEDVDINRTVGWFTSQYPLLLDLKNNPGGKDKSLSYTIKTVKETLRRIPNKGINYGILKYLTKKALQAADHIEPLREGTLREGVPLCEGPEISFNYLGQFDKETAPGFFQMSTMSGGNGVSP
ncbi:MAG: non-ribosomal peptide synthetase, partial [bacterium]|nr:non-ribosomal peptide synthetase [bacterium]